MVARVVIGLIEVYRYLISPFTRPSCRFIPSCSQYAIHAINHHGVVKGIILTFKRLFKCHPFSSEMGFDPIPEPKSLKKS